MKVLTVGLNAYVGKDGKICELKKRPCKRICLFCCSCFFNASHEVDEEDPEMAAKCGCGRKHWELELPWDCELNAAKLRKAFATAETCEDFDAEPKRDWGFGLLAAVLTEGTLK